MIMFKPTIFSQNFIYLNFCLNLTQLHINFLRQEHQIKHLWVSAYTSIHFSFRYVLELLLLILTSTFRIHLILMRIQIKVMTISLRFTEFFFNKAGQTNFTFFFLTPFRDQEIHGSAYFCGFGSTKSILTNITLSPPH